MAPIDNNAAAEAAQQATAYAPLRENMSDDSQILEAWGEGWNVGAMIILILIVICNYRRKNILHKLIALELILAMPHGTFIFAPDPYYGWYLSSTATLLFISYQIHNVVSWLKIKPFLPVWGSRVFIISLMAVQPFWIAEAWSNFEYFNHLGSDANTKMRPWEFLARDPWWIFVTWKLLRTIGRSYGFTLPELVRINARFGVMLGCMFLSIGFIIADMAVTLANLTAGGSGINPYWRMALVFKCGADCFFLDDFKTVLDQISEQSLSRAAGGNSYHHGGGGGSGGTALQQTSSVNAGVSSRAEGPVDNKTNDNADQLKSNSSAPSGKRNWRHRVSSPTTGSRSRSGGGGAITVHREMTVTTELKQPHRPQSYNSDVALVPQGVRAANSAEDEDEMELMSPKMAVQRFRPLNNTPQAVQVGNWPLANPSRKKST